MTREIVYFAARDSEQQIDVFVGGAFFTSYLYRQGTLKKPVLYPLIAASGVEVTRGYPLATRPGERIDHPHHYGLWFNHGDVNGVDFWNNSDAVPEEEKQHYGSIIHTKASEMQAGEEGRLSVEKDWVMPDGQVILKEKTKYTFSGGEHYRQIDHHTILTATEQAVIFKDSKEGMFALRVARQLELPSDEPVILTDENLELALDKIVSQEGVTGNYLNSEGVEGYDVWGRRARWVKLSGEIRGDSIAIAIMDDPGNPNHPPHWMARGYGLFGVNPFGSKIYSEGKEELNFELQPGESVAFRHRVIIFDGSDPSRGEVEGAYWEFRRSLETSTSVPSTSVPFQIQEGLFDHSKPKTLGLSPAPGAETFTIFRPQKDENKYNHGVVLLPFKGRLYAQWQTSSRDEDAPDTYVAYSNSPNGKDWTEPKTLAPQWEDGYKTGGGWWTDGETLVAYINAWPSRPGTLREGYTEYMTSTDGDKWTTPQPLLDNEGQPMKGIIEQGLHALPDGRIIGAVHQQPGLIVSPYYTDDPKGISGWTKGSMPNLPHSGTVSRELEPAWFYRADGAIVMVFRDQDSSFRKLASVSFDRGKTWTTPVLTEMPDSRSKQSAGNLPDGTAFQVNNPSGNKNRYPLAIVLSKDGKLFDKAYLLRSDGADLQERRYEGRYKRAGYSYPKSVVWKEYLYVSYATNKEDVELTRVPLEGLSE